MNEITRLEQLRIDAGLTQRELALKAGVLPKIITDAERGARTNPRNLAKLGRALGVPASTLLLRVVPEIVEPDFPDDLPSAA